MAKRVKKTATKKTATKKKAAKKKVTDRNDDLLLMREWSEKNNLGLSDDELREVADQIDAAFSAGNN